MSLYNFLVNRCIHDDVIKWRHFLRYWPFMRGIHWSPVNSPHKGQWRGALMFSLISAWINGWVNNRETSDMRRHRAHCDVIVMTLWIMRAGWNVRHGLCHIYMIYVYIWVVYSFCLFCCLFIIVTTQFVAQYKPCKPKPKPSTYDGAPFALRVQWVSL